MFEELLANLEKSIKNLEKLRKSRLHRDPARRLMDSITGMPLNEGRDVSIFRTGRDGILYSRNSDSLQEPASWDSILKTTPHAEDEHEERGTGGLHSRYFHTWPRDTAGAHADLRNEGSHSPRVRKFIDSMGEGVVARQERARQEYLSEIEKMKATLGKPEDSDTSITPEPASRPAAGSVGQWEGRRIARARAQTNKEQREARSGALLAAARRGVQAHSASDKGLLGINVSDEPVTEFTAPVAINSQTEPTQPDAQPTNRMRGTIDHPEAFSVPGITPENYAGTRTGKDGKVEHLRWARSWELNFAQTMSELLHKNIESILDDLSKSSNTKTQIVVKPQRGTR